MPIPNARPLRMALRRALVPVGGALLIRCDATGPRGPAAVSLSVAPMPGTIAVGNGPNSLRITNVQFVIAETEMAQAVTRDLLQRNPILINLPLGARAPRKVLNATVPGGRYTGLQARLRAPGSDFATLHPDWPASVSVRVAGVYTDANNVVHDFTFVSGVDAQLQIAFAHPITVDAVARNVTMAVNVARWFRNAQGAVVDPRNRANAAAINKNIERSFQAFQDDDGDGVDDDPSEIDDDMTDVEDDERDDDTTDVEDDDHDDDDHDDDDTTDIEDGKNAAKPSSIEAWLVVKR
jgi:hypothetical protein